jgi:hypothetical protein
MNSTATTAAEKYIYCSWDAADKSFRRYELFESCRAAAQFGYRGPLQDHVFTSRKTSDRAAACVFIV